MRTFALTCSDCGEPNEPFYRCSKCGGTRISVPLTAEPVYDQRSTLSVAVQPINHPAPKADQQQAQRVADGKTSLGPAELTSTE